MKSYSSATYSLNRLMLHGFYLDLELIRRKGSSVRIFPAYCKSFHRYITYCTDTMQVLNTTNAGNTYEYENLANNTAVINRTHPRNKAILPTLIWGDDFPKTPYEVRK